MPCTYKQLCRFIYITVYKSLAKCVGFEKIIPQEAKHSNTLENTRHLGEHSEGFQKLYYL